MTIKQGRLHQTVQINARCPMAEKGQKDGVKAALLPPDLLDCRQLHFLFLSQSPALCQSRTTGTHETGQDPSPWAPAFASEVSYLGFCMSFTFSLELVPLRVISSFKWTFEEGWSTFRRWFCIWIRGNHHTQRRMKCLVFLRQQRRLLRNNSNNKPKNKQMNRQTSKQKTNQTKKTPKQKTKASLFFKL